MAGVEYTWWMRDVLACFVIVTVTVTACFFVRELSGLQPLAPRRFYVGARGHKSCPGPLKFLDTVVLLLVELIGSIVNFA